MRWALYDTADPRKRLVTEPAPWRAFLQLLWEEGVIRRASADRLVWYLGGEGTSINAAEARAIGEFVRKAVLPALSRSEDLHLPMSPVSFDHASTPTIPPRPAKTEDEEEKEEDAVLSHEWIQSLADLCAECGGLGVLVEGLPSRPTRG